MPFIQTSNGRQHILNRQVAQIISGADLATVQNSRKWYHKIGDAIGATHYNRTINEFHAELWNNRPNKDNDTLLNVIKIVRNKFDDPTVFDEKFRLAVSSINPSSLTIGFGPREHQITLNENFNLRSKFHFENNGNLGKVAHHNQEQEDVLESFNNDHMDDNDIDLRIVLYNSHDNQFTLEKHKISDSTFIVKVGPLESTVIKVVGEIPLQDDKPHEDFIKLTLKHDTNDEVFDKLPGHNLNTKLKFIDGCKVARQIYKIAEIESLSFRDVIAKRIGSDVAQNLDSAEIFLDDENALGVEDIDCVVMQTRIDDLDTKFFNYESGQVTHQMTLNGLLNHATVRLGNAYNKTYNTVYLITDPTTNLEINLNTFNQYS